MIRRYAHAAGYSWRKWEDPLMAGRALRDRREGARVRAILWLLLCIDTGALLAAMVAR